MCLHADKKQSHIEKTMFVKMPTYTCGQVAWHSQKVIHNSKVRISPLPFSGRFISGVSGRRKTIPKHTTSHSNKACDAEERQPVHSQQPAKILFGGVGTPVGSSS